MSSNVGLLKQTLGVDDTESSADPEECNESEDEEESNGESAGKQVVHPRKPEKISVKWSKADTAIIGEAFRDFIYNEKEKKNCSGSLPSKGKLITFLRETQLESLSMLPEKGQYLKTRAKVFNERKTAREKTCQAMKKMAAGKTK